MKKINGKNKIILLSSLSFSALASSVVVSSALEKKTNISIDTISTTSLKNQRDISTNIEQTSNLQNPNELFYTSEKLDPKNASVITPETESTQAPSTFLVNSSNSTIDTTSDNASENLKKWTNFKTNLEALVKEGTTSTLVNELIEICNQVEGTYNLNEALKELNELADSNNLIKETLEQLKQTVISNSGSYQQMEQIPNIDAIKEKLLQLSGIVEGTQIGLIKNPESFTKKDLSQKINGNGTTTQSNTTTNNNGNMSIDSVAGDQYKQLIKIAEIDPSQTGNYALMFEYKTNSSDFAKQGTLYIKNDQGQLQSILSSSNDESSETQSGIAKLKSSLDIFGRFNVQNGSISNGNNGSGGTNSSGGVSYPNKLENFIIQVNSENKVEILVRIKDQEMIEDLKFATTADLPGASNLAQPTKFGILDVQADQNSTFRSLVENYGQENGETTSHSSKKTVLVDDINGNNIVKEVQFFSNTLSSNRSQSVDNDNKVLQDRQLEFYQGPNVNLSLPLYFAFDKTYLKDGNFDQNTQTFSYKSLNIFVGGNDSNSQQMININSLSDKASTIEPNFFSMDETLIKELEANNSPKISENFKDASKIQLKSTFDNTTTFTKQTLTFSDFFYAIGQREEGWFSINRVNPTTGITILDPTQKIFLEKPENFSDSANNTANTITSETFAQETINERTKVVDILSSIYEQFSKSNSGDFQGQRFSLGLVNLWSFSKSGTNYRNIRLTQKNVSGSGYDIFNTLNSNWTDLSNIMNSIFGASTSPTRYQTKDAVGNYLANITEFTANSVAVETILSDSISIVKNSLQSGTLNENTNYDSLTNEGKNELAKKLVELISLQFSTISNEFSMRQYEPIYQELKKVIYDNQQTKSQYQLIANPSTIFELTSVDSLGGADLITYKENAWNNLATSQETTLSHAVYNLLLLIYHSNAASGDLLSIKLGDSIFSSSESNKNFRSLSPFDLVNLNSDSINSKAVKVSIYNQILTFFGSSSFDMQNIINQMLKTGKTVNEVWNINLDSAFRTVINNIVSNEPRREVTTNNNIKVKSYYLDDVISGTNAIITLVARLKQLGVSTINNSNNNQNVTNADLISKINSILNSNSQASSSELSIWSNIVNGSYDYAQYSSELSGRTGKENVQKVATTIASNEAILNARASLTSPAIVELQSILKILWWVVVALIGVGILVSSSVGIGIKHKEEKLSTHPVLKWILVSGIVLGTIVLVLAIVLGVLAI